MTTTFKRLSLILLASTLAAACIGVPDDAPATGDDDVTAPGGDDDSRHGAPTTFTRTIVTLSDDGSELVKTVQVTREQQARELAVRGGAQTEGSPGALASISSDASCLASSLWLFDQTNDTGNELCFKGTGVVNLGSYCRTASCTSTWRRAVRSYWAGVDIGAFSANGSYTCSTGDWICPFNAYQHRTVAASCEQQGGYVKLGNQFCVPA